MADVNSLQSYLRSVAMTSAPGERLPTVRKLMQDFGLTQPNVQRVLNALKEEGLIVAHVGRGTFFTGPLGEGRTQVGRSQPERRARSVILLRRSSHNLRGRVVVDQLQQKIAAAGDLTLEVGYSNADHARQVLQTLPRFDACIVQNAFEAMPVEMISAIRRKTDTIVVDGAWLVGTDVDAVGFEWGEPIEKAVRHLVDTGHDRIFLVTTQSFFLANEMGLHRYRNLRVRPELALVLQPEIRLPQLPPKDYEESVVAALSGSLAGAGDAKQAVIIWGIDDGAKLRALLEHAGFPVPEQVSVILLGRTDLDPEASGFFHVIGYSALEQAEGVFQRLLDRWQNPSAPFGLRLMPLHERAGRSVRGLTGSEIGKDAAEGGLPRRMAE